MQLPNRGLFSLSGCEQLSENWSGAEWACLPGCGRDFLLLNVPVSVPAHTALTEAEWLGLGVTFKGHLLQPSGSNWGHFQLEKVAQRSLRPDLVYLQG